MKTGKYISDIVPLTQSQWKRNQMNFFQADTGQGKTVAAIHTIPQYLDIPARKCLILIDTNAGKENKINTDGCKKWIDEDEDKPTIMTYAEFAVLLRAQKLFSNTFAYIACDEVHNLAKYARVDRINIINRNPDYDSDTINIILSRESLNYRAFETLKRWCSGNSGPWIFGFSATPRMLEEWIEAEGFLNKILHSEELIVYEVLNKIYYNDIHNELCENPTHKRLIHASTIKQVEEFTQEIKDSTGRNAIGLWSRNSTEKKMDSKQIETLEYLMRDECFPPDVDDIVATEAYSTGYNIKDDNVCEIIVHTGNEDIQVQFKGRKRNDLQILKLYDSKKSKSKRKNEKKREKIVNKEIEIPIEFLNVKLNKEKRDELLKKISFPKGWNLFCKACQGKYEFLKGKRTTTILPCMGKKIPPPVPLERGVKKCPPRLCADDAR